MTDPRTADLHRFYDLLARLKGRVGMRRLKECSSSSEWPDRGVYFFFEQGETRSGSGDGLRVVRVGTHAITSRSRATLWNRLAQHRGTTKSGGNHRGSVFRKLVGGALAKKYPRLATPTWDNSSASPRERAAERPLEEEVSRYIGAMPFLWIEVEDPPSPSSRRLYIERHSIALLSSVVLKVDPPSTCWLGLLCPHPDVAQSGLWNSRHVHEKEYDRKFLDKLERLVPLSPLAPPPSHPKTKSLRARGAKRSAPDTASDRILP